MFKYRIITMPILTLLILGCVNLEVSPGKQSNLRNAPINELSRAGIVSYSKEVFIEENERQDAYDTMAESCNGAYRILNEEIKRGAGNYITDEDYVLGLDEDRVYISFICVKKV